MEDKDLERLEREARLDALIDAYLDRYGEDALARYLASRRINKATPPAQF